MWSQLAVRCLQMLGMYMWLREPSRMDCFTKASGVSHGRSPSDGYSAIELAHNLRSLNWISWDRPLAKKYYSATEESPTGTAKAPPCTILGSTNLGLFYQKRILISHATMTGNQRLAHGSFKQLTDLI